MQRETYSGGHKECKDQNRDKAFIHVIPVARFGFYMILRGGRLMYDLAGKNGLDLEALCARLRRMSDGDLLRFGRAARYMCSPAANLGKEPRQVFVMQSKKAVEEWRRRHPLG